MRSGGSSTWFFIGSITTMAMTDSFWVITKILAVKDDSSTSNRFAFTCNGCDKQFSESAAEAIDLLFTIGRKESDVYPFLHPDGQKSWRYGSETNKYYHLIVSCLSRRHPNFSLSHLTPPQLDVNLSTYSQPVQEHIKDAFLRRFNINLSQMFSPP